MVKQLRTGPIAPPLPPAPKLSREAFNYLAALLKETEADAEQVEAFESTIESALRSAQRTNR